MKVKFLRNFGTYKAGETYSVGDYAGHAYKEGNYATEVGSETAKPEPKPCKCKEDPENCEQCKDKKQVEQPIEVVTKELKVATTKKKRTRSKK